MRLSQKHADHEAEIDAMMAYIANEDGMPNDNAWSNSLKTLVI